MLLRSYQKEIIRPECRPEAESVHCIAHLDQDIGEVIPYLNAVLGGFQLRRPRRGAPAGNQSSHQR